LLMVYMWTGPRMVMLKMVKSACQSRFPLVRTQGLLRMAEVLRRKAEVEEME
jgi:hypothetical protein